MIRKYDGKEIAVAMLSAISFGQIGEAGPFEVHEDVYDRWEDTYRIREALGEVGLDLSTAEACIFWLWYSEKLDASFLVVPQEEEQIVKIFDDFMREFNGSDQEGKDNE